MKFAFGQEEGRNWLHAALMIIQSKSSLFYRIPTDEQHSKLYPAYALEHALQTGSTMLISLLVHCQLMKRKGSYVTLDSIGFQSFKEEYKDTLHVEVVKYRPDRFDSCAKRPERCQSQQCPLNQMSIYPTPHLVTKQFDFKIS